MIEVIIKICNIVIFVEVSRKVEWISLRTYSVEQEEVVTEHKKQQAVVHRAPETAGTRPQSTRNTCGETVTFSGGARSLFFFPCIYKSNSVSHMFVIFYSRNLHVPTRA